MDGKEREELEAWEKKKVEGNGKMGGCPSDSCHLDKIPSQKAAYRRKDFISAYHSGYSASLQVTNGRDRWSQHTQSTAEK